MRIIHRLGAAALLAALAACGPLPGRDAPPSPLFGQMSRPDRFAPTDGERGTLGHYGGVAVGMSEPEFRAALAGMHYAVQERPAAAAGRELVARPAGGCAPGAACETVTGLLRDGRVALLTAHVRLAEPQTVRQVLAAAEERYGPNPMPRFVDNDVVQGHVPVAFDWGSTAITPRPPRPSLLLTVADGNRALRDQSVTEYSIEIADGAPESPLRSAVPLLPSTPRG